MTTATRDRGRAAERRGRWAETVCAVRLLMTGWRVIDRRLGGGRGTGVGEIDIVARRGRTLAFIEVKARGDDATALEALSESQRARLVRAAEVFVARHPKLAGLEMRFDVMMVTGGLWPQHLVDAWRP